MTFHEDFSADEREDEAGRGGEFVSAAEVLAFANHHLVCQAREHPYRTLAAALGVGYILGAGVPRLVVRMARMMVMRSAVDAVLASDSAREIAQGLWQKLEGFSPSQRPINGSSNRQRRTRQDRRSKKSNQQKSGETTH